MYLWLFFLQITIRNSEIVKLEIIKCGENAQPPKPLNPIEFQAGDFEIGLIQTYCHLPKGEVVFMPVITLLGFLQEKKNLIFLLMIFVFIWHDINLKEK